MSISLTELGPALAIDLAREITRGWELQSKADIGWHLHPEKQEGGSNLGGCPYDRGYKKSGLPIPQKTGLKAKFGRARMGTLLHGVLEPAGLNVLVKKYPQYIFEPVIDENGKLHEVYIRIEIIPGYWVVTPIDFGMVTPPGFIKTTLEFQDGPREVYMKHPDAKWVRIWDFKSCDAGKFDTLAEKGLTPEYDGQGLIEMRATGCRFIPFLFINKSDTEFLTISCEWSDERWAALQAKFRRELEIADALKNKKLILWQKSDFRWFTSVENVCLYCVHSITHEVPGKGNKRYLIFDEPCPRAKALVESDALELFVPGSMWTSGKSFLTITEVKNGMIYSVNKGGKLFTDSLFNAMKKFKPGWAPKEKADSSPSIHITDEDIKDL